MGPFTRIPVQNTQVTAAVHGLTLRNGHETMHSSSPPEHEQELRTPLSKHGHILRAKRLRNGCPLTRWASRTSGA